MTVTLHNMAVTAYNEKEANDAKITAKKLRVLQRAVILKAMKTFGCSWDVIKVEVVPHTYLFKICGEILHSDPNDNTTLHFEAEEEYITDANFKIKLLRDINFYYWRKCHKCGIIIAIDTYIDDLAKLGKSFTLSHQCAAKLACWLRVSKIY